MHSRDLAKIWVILENLGLILKKITASEGWECCEKAAGGLSLHILMFPYVILSEYHVSRLAGL